MDMKLKTQNGLGATTMVSQHLALLNASDNAVFNFRQEV